MENRHDVLGVDGFDAPFLLTTGQAEHAIGETQDDSQFVALTFFGLGHFGNLKTLARQFLDQLLQDLKTKFFCKTFNIGKGFIAY